MTLEERLNQAKIEVDMKIAQLNQLDQSRSNVSQEIIRLDERIKLLTELIREQNK